MFTRFFNIFLYTGFISAAVTIGHAQRASEALLLIRPAEYFGTTYTAPAAENSNYVFFANELLVGLRVVAFVTVSRRSDRRFGGTADNYKG